VEAACIKIGLNLLVSLSLRMRTQRPWRPGVLRRLRRSGVGLRPRVATACSGVPRKCRRLGFREQQEEEEEEEVAGGGPEVQEVRR